MKRTDILKIILVSMMAAPLTACQEKSKGVDGDHPVIENKYTPLKTLEEEGLVGSRVDAWRNHRLWYIYESGYLMDGFENRPGVHPWQGEHLGKWLHAATLAYRATGDEKIKHAMESMVERLLAVQEPNGYLGTYADENTFVANPESVDPNTLAEDTYSEEEMAAFREKWRKVSGGWDTWTHRYNLYGLLVYESEFPDERIVEACRKMADLLIEVYGEGQHDLTKYGTRRGISATTLLESIVMLYERTGEEKYLDFAEHIVEMSEQNPHLRLMDAMLKKETVVYPGDGKGYQLMANLLGYLRLYRATGNEKYLTAVLNGWQEIHDKHLLVTGGPWTMHMPYNGNSECFAFTKDFQPEIGHVENCCTVTWMQMNIHLFELTGDAKYIQEAEVALLNDLYAHQHPEGIEWCYYIAPNEAVPPYEKRFHCCASSGPRGLEMYSNNLAGVIGDHLVINSLSSFTSGLPDQFGGGTLSVKGDYPSSGKVDILIDPERAKQFTVEFMLPAATTLTRVSVNGEQLESGKNERGFHEVIHRWSPGDVLAVEMAYHLESHVQEGEDGQKWVAFTYGPLALAQKVEELPDQEPFEGLEDTPDKSGNILRMIDGPLEPGTDMEFAIRGTGITLQPYYKVYSRDSGPKTYFKL